MGSSRPRILFIDAYDSFTNNIVCLLTTTLACDVRIVHIDNIALQDSDALHTELANYDAVVCGPGPGNPTIAKDVGLMSKIWDLSEEHMLPVLGICLGFQSLGARFGGEIKPLERAMHGIVQRVWHSGRPSCATSRPPLEDDIYAGVGTPLRATLYHSLQVDLGHNMTGLMESTDEMWEAGAYAGDLVPLAWTRQHYEDFSEEVDEPRWVLMAMRHRSKPFWGLQYHPESICTSTEHDKVIKNWFKVAQQWNGHHRSYRHSQAFIGDIIGTVPQPRSLLSRAESRGLHRTISGPNTERTSEPLHWQNISIPTGVTVPEIVECVNGNSQNHMILESSNGEDSRLGTSPVRGRCSIIACNVDACPKYSYQVGCPYYRVHTPSSSPKQFRINDRTQFWEVLAAKAHVNRIDASLYPDIPFLGGFIGYTTYEAGLETIDVEVETVDEIDAVQPDMLFVWVEDSIVVDHVDNMVYVLTRRRHSWHASTVEKLTHLFEAMKHSVDCVTARSDTEVLYSGIARLPLATLYEAKVQQCQQQIGAGEAYELCLTDQANIRRPRRDLKHTAQYNTRSSQPHITTTDAWQIYKTLRSQQPAPMASFIRLDALTYLSASPERFLKWDERGECELRPMKGTVKKTAKVTTRKQAELLLQTTKERAENLMIVDLVRHDLHGICGAGNVHVPQLMVVEEYASVFQMITVVQGQLENAAGHVAVGYTGLDVLATSLPPGSMTGAPKKRACTILQDIESRPRGLYSGVVGYIDIGGRGDWAVNIRCLVRWDDEAGTPDGSDGEDDRTDSAGGLNASCERPLPARSHEQDQGCEQELEEEVWHIGAGGAVTILSDVVAEREEMQTKLAGSLALFGHVAA